MIAQLFFQVKHLQKKKQDLENPYAAQIGIYRFLSAEGAKASPWGLRPQARFGAQPPKAALSAEMKLATIFDF